MDETGLRAGVRRLLTTGVVVSAALMAFGLLAGSSVALGWGIFALVCTPAVRVAWLAAGYAWERDWAFCAVSLGVLALLLSGAWLGRLN